MARIADFVTKGEYVDVTMQSALREIDSHQLSIAMLGFSEEERLAVLRNMSKRAAALLTEEIEAVDGKQNDIAISDAVEMFEQKLTKYSRHFADDQRNSEIYFARYQRRAKGEEETPTEPEAPPIVDFTSLEAILDSFRKLKRFIQEYGILSLEGAEEGIDNPVAKKAFQLLIDGWDPLVMRSILERAMQSYFESERRKLEMVIEGFGSLSTKEHLVGLEEQLSSYLY